jgi:branched-chain amino acid transport system substrate-binding protein
VAPGGAGQHRFRTPRIAALFVALVVALVVAANGALPLGSSPAVAAAGTSSGRVTPPDRASTSTRGIVGKRINVVFPVANISNLSSELGFAGDPEDVEQVKAIKFYVGQINRDGGINGRKINPIIVNFDPTDEAGMRSLCKDWTEGSPAAFAVVDGLGAWSGDNELCITQEDKTPMLAQWSTVTNWTTTGSPYLWWIGPDQSVILRTLVSWASSARLIGAKMKLGIVVGDRASDQLALNEALLPALKAAGIDHPLIETIAAEPGESAATGSDAPLIVDKLRSAGVTAVIPLVPVTALFPYLGAETSEKYFPRLLLSDYEDSIEIGLGLIPIPYEQALNGQEGVTVETLGGIDDDRPESQGGYDPGVRSCFTSFLKSPTYPFPDVAAGHKGKWIEEQGPIASWCEGIRLFAEAAEKAGPHLNRRSFVEAMSRIQGYPGTLSPTLSYGPDKFYGPTEYRVVSLHNNSAAHNKCIDNYLGHVQATCWDIVQNWKPLVTSG